MNKLDTETAKLIESTIKQLLSSDNEHYHVDRTLPSLQNIHLLIEKFRAIIFPGFFGTDNYFSSLHHYRLVAELESFAISLKEQIKCGFCFACDRTKCDPNECDQHAVEILNKFLQEIPSIKILLYGDVEAAFSGDPAAKNRSETIFCYPGIRAIINHRFAHALLGLGVPLIPRIISESAHSETGIDIHPGAQIGKNFFIDHGTGVVIGETSIIGNNVKIYQGVTLGAKSFAADSDGNLIKDIPRHPIIEDNVTIYAGATILGRITIGANSVIGGNVWLTQSVLPNGKITVN